MEPNTLDHVAFWVTERDAIVDFATAELGMHVIDRQDNFTLIGSDARRGKLTLFDADRARERGAFKHVALRVSSSDAAGSFTLPEGIEGRLLEAPTDVEYDLDRVALYTSDPEVTAETYLDYGFSPAEPKDGVPGGGVGGAPGARVGGGGPSDESHEGDPADGERPLLNHLAVLVDSADDHKRDAEEQGI